MGFKVIAYDYEKNWLEHLKITSKLCNELAPTEIKFCVDYDIKIKTSAPKQLDANQTDIVFLQNYLSHIGDDENSFNNFLKWFADIMARLKIGAFFVLVDFGYDSTRKIFDAIIDESFLDSVSASIISAHCDGEPFKIHYPMVPYGLYKNVFTDEAGLGRRFVTKYYYVVLQKGLIF